MADNLPKEFLAERDARIFSLKKSGLSNSDIAKRFEMTASAVASATRRQLNRLNSEAFLAYPEVLRLELERLDEMQKSLWPLTQFRREEMEDGSVITVEPDQRAVQTVLGIMDRRARLLGMNVERVDVALNTLGEATVVDARSTLAGSDASALPAGSDPKEESMQLLELMGQSGVLDSTVLGQILGNVRDTIEVSSEIVEEEDGTIIVSVDESEIENVK